jgi:alcohol dehydrogenase (cytochrome c)
MRWRSKLLWGRLTGDYSEIPITTFVRWLRPDTEVNLFPLLENHNLRASIGNPLANEASADVGDKIYATHCARCHGENAKGGAGPNLVASIGRISDWTFFATVKWGRGGTIMQAQPLSDHEIWLTHAFVRRLLRAGSTRADSRRFHVNVDPRALLDDADPGDEWLTYAGNYSGHRHSRLSQISTDNVRSIRLAWTGQFKTADESSQGSPIAAGGLVFVTANGGKVLAFDAESGRPAWDFARAPTPGTQIFGSTGNRGVAVLGGDLFVTTLDAHLLAIDASTGQAKWDVRVADNREGYTMTAAPLAVRDRVVVGVAGGDYGARGFISAFSASDGRRLWQFDAVPPPGAFGHDTWAGDSWVHGGAATWVTGAYDPGLGLLYWGVANAAPVYRADLRGGDNLFAMCAVALDLDAGQRKWHFQFSPNDEHDWDAAEQPIVADVRWEGTPKRALLWANRNGFFYGLDRQDGRFLFAKAFVPQTWSKGFGPEGRPILDPAAKPSPGGTLVRPWVGGATNWQPPSYDPERGLVFVPTMDAAALFFRDETGFEPGGVFRGGASRLADNEPARVGVTAIDAGTGETRWQTWLETGLDAYTGIGGAMSTAGGLVWVGYREELLALRAENGEVLWRVRLGGRINGSPIAYAVNGREYVAVMAGSSLFVFSLPTSSEQARPTGGSLQ